MMEQLTDHHYEVLTVPEESAANCIYIKGPSKRDFLLHRPAEECPDSVSVSTALIVQSKTVTFKNRHIVIKLKDYRSILCFFYLIVMNENKESEPAAASAVIRLCCNL